MTWVSVYSPVWLLTTSTVVYRPKLFSSTVTTAEHGNNRTHNMICARGIYIILLVFTMILVYLVLLQYFGTEKSRIYIFRSKLKLHWQFSFEHFKNSNKHYLIAYLQLFANIAVLLSSIYCFFIMLIVPCITNA